MRASEAWLAERDVPKLNLMVRSSNTEVQRFYGNLGYIDDEVIVLSRRLSHR